MRTQIRKAVLSAGVGAIVLSAVGTTRAATIYGVTASMDNGTTLTSGAITGDTWYIQGWNTGAPTTGLPMNINSQNTFTSAADANKTYRLQPQIGNNTLLVDASAGGGTNSATLTLPTPTAFTGFTVLTSSGNGTGTLTPTFNFSDGTTSTAGTAFTSPDWFGNTPVAINSNGRVDAATGKNFNNIGAGNPRLYDEVFSVPASVVGHPVSSISLAWSTTGTNTHTAIFALSGTLNGTTYSPINLAASNFNQNMVVPEPASIGLAGVAALGLLARRRRA